MSHAQQQDFCKRVKEKYPEYFLNKNVLDVGSLDINGNNRYLFDNCSYLGIDVGSGNNVDVVSLAHEFNSPDNYYDVVISTECFEHDMYYEKSIKNIIRMLKPGGMFLFTCASDGRPEHGTNKTKPEDAPLLSAYDNWGDYYKNLNEQDIRSIVNIDDTFSKYYFEYEPAACDLYFYGFKK